MQSQHSPPPDSLVASARTKALMLPISAVELVTGLAKDTLRIWERRYGFPVPLRNGADDRIYPQEQINKLLTIKRLMSAGWRPGQIVQRSMDELLALENEGALSATDLTPISEPSIEGTVELKTNDAVLKAYALLVDCEINRFTALLHQQLILSGVERFVLEFVAPLTAVVGLGWQKHEIKIYQEHWYTDCVRGLLQHVQTQMAASHLQNFGNELGAANAPRILLTTLPGEEHSLGLLMAQSLFQLQASTCISIGLSTPIQDIVGAAQAYKADVVALSCSAYGKPRQCLENLRLLRQSLPPSTGLWVGGQNQALTTMSSGDKTRAAGITVLRDLGDIARQVKVWRKERDQALAARQPS
jgi:MerR family transcriptional regulator, light-induced transcriptional regulator